MECLLQYLDDLDDLYGVAGLLWENLRRAFITFVVVCVLLATAAGAIWLAIVNPLVALGTSTVLFVILIYRSVTAPTLKSFA
jgi:ATP/ADP translocase